MLAVLVSASLGASPARAEPTPKLASRAQIATGKTAPVRRAPVRRHVEVLWGGSWWQAEVLESRGGSSKIHYTGWGPEWDEWVGAARMRAPSAPLASASTGQRVEIEWHGSWWAGQVLAERAGLYKVHYTGWGPEWDEWVEIDRLRGR